MSSSDSRRPDNDNETPDQFELRSSGGLVDSPRINVLYCFLCANHTVWSIQVSATVFGARNWLITCTIFLAFLLSIAVAHFCAVCGAASNPLLD